jgi:hypothetical protein
MAKSLRSRSKLAARTAKRRDPNSDYAVAEAARTNALAKRQAERIRGKKLREQEAAEAQAEQGDEAEGEWVRRALRGCGRCVGGTRLRCARLAQASARARSFRCQSSRGSLTRHAGTMEVDGDAGDADVADEADADAQGRQGHQPRGPQQEQRARQAQEIGAEQCLAALRQQSALSLSPTPASVAVVLAARPRHSFTAVAVPASFLLQQSRSRSAIARTPL